MNSLFGFGSSNITTKANLGFEDGNIDAKVFTFFFEYPPFIGWSAVPVFPPTSKPLTFANPAVPSLVDTIFLNIGLICDDTFWLIILSFSILFLFLINVGLILNPPLLIID